MMTTPERTLMKHWRITAKILVFVIFTAKKCNLHGWMQSTFSCKYSAFSGLDCLTLGASREPLMEAHEAYQVSKRNLFFGNWNFILENEMLLNNVSIFRFYAKSWQEREWNSENGPSDNFFLFLFLSFEFNEHQSLGKRTFWSIIDIYHRSSRNMIFNINLYIKYSCQISNIFINDISRRSWEKSMREVKFIM